MSAASNFKKSISRNKAPAILLIVSVIIFFLWLFLADKIPDKQGQVVATVNSEAITSSELHHFMLLNKAEVYNHFYRTYDASYSEGFWDKNFNGVKPVTMLKKQSLDDAVSYKVQQILAKEQGMPVITNFDSLMRERKKINKIRKGKVENDRVIYGPVHFSPRNYVNKIRDEMVRSTKNVLSESDFKISDEKLKQLYKQYKTRRESLNIGRDDKQVNSFDAFKAVTQNQYTDKRYTELVKKLSANAEVKINTQIYNEISIK